MNVLTSRHGGFAGSGMRVFASVLFVFLCTLAMSAQASLPGGISGAWFNPAQGGHGFSIEVLGDGRAIAYWFVYDPQGRPIHLYVDGTVQGRTIAGPAYRHDGMRFGLFDPTQNVRSTWGRVEITFDDCNHGRLHYDGNGPAGAGYGAGDMPLLRLSQIAGSSCELGVAGALPAGLYDTGAGRLPDDGSIFPVGRTLAGAVDPDGQFWATPDVPPGPGSDMRDLRPPLFIGEAGVRVAGQVPLRFSVLSDTGIGSPLPPNPIASVDITVTVSASAATGSYRPVSGGNATVLTGMTLAYSPARSVAVHRPFVLADVAGVSFRMLYGGHVIGYPLLLRIEANGDVCFAFEGAIPPGSCPWRGRMSPSHPGWTFFDFTLAHGTATPFSGRGWVEYDGAVARRIVLVGSDGSQGLGFVANRVP